jgi:hypothetical protein
MNRWQTFRIALLLLAIFAGGFAAGRLTAPTPATASASPGFTGPAGRVYTVDDVLARLTGELRLDDAQRARIRPIVEETVRRMSRLPPRSPERLAAYEDCMAKLRPLLRLEQQPAVDRLRERARRTFGQREN